MIYMGGSCPLWLRLGKTQVSRGIVGKAWNPFKGIAFFLPFVTNYPSWVQVGSRTWGGGADEKASAVGAWWGFSPQTPSDRRSVWRADSSSHYCPRIRICGPENFGFEIYAPEKLAGEMDDFGPPLRTPLSRSHLASSSGLLWMLYMWH